MHPYAALIAAYQRIVDSQQSVDRALSLQNSRRVMFGSAARALRIERFGEKSLRHVARQLKISAAFLSQFELGERWSDDIAFALKDFLINASPSSGETKP